MSQNIMTSQLSSSGICFSFLFYRTKKNLKQGGTFLEDAPDQNVSSNADFVHLIMFWLIFIFLYETMLPVGFSVQQEINFSNGKHCIVIIIKASNILHNIDLILFVLLNKFFDVFYICSSGV